MQRIKFVIIIVSLIGTITPFVDSIVIIQFFYLLIPLSIIFLISVAYLVGRLIFKGPKETHSLLVALIVPTLLASQMIAAFAVNEIQRFRSERIISEIESTGVFNIEMPFGIRVIKMEHSNSFRVCYSRGFMVNEIYDSSLKSWESSGWND